MLSDKIWDLRFANFVVWHLRQLCKRKKQDFRCVARHEKTSVEIDNVIDGTQIVEVNMPMRCIDFDACKKCNQDCENRDWNNSYIDLLECFRAAKRDRNHAILDLFKIKHK